MMSQCWALPLRAVYVCVYHWYTSHQLKGQVTVQYSTCLRPGMQHSTPVEPNV